MKPMKENREKTQLRGGVAHPYNIVAETGNLYVQIEVLAVRRLVGRKHRDHEIRAFIERTMLSKRLPANN